LRIDFLIITLDRQVFLVLLVRAELDFTLLTISNSSSMERLQFSCWSSL